jgi:ankyrin repeat protein
MVTLLSENLKKEIHNGTDANYSWLDVRSTLENMMSMIDLPRYDLLQIILWSGVDINAPDEEQGSLFLAVSGILPDIEAIRILYEHGADINADDEYYGNVLHLLISNVHQISTDVIRFLIENGADVNAQGGKYGHALQAASATADIDVVRFLVENNADVNAQGGEYGHALQAASVEGDLDVVDFLIQNGADANAQGSSVRPCRLTLSDCNLGRS